MYAMVCTRRELRHSASTISKYTTNSGIVHWKTFKWIFRYLIGKANKGIMLAKQDDSISVVWYIDIDYDGDLNNNMSTIGHVFTIARGPIFYRSVL